MLPFVVSYAGKWTSDEIMHILKDDKGVPYVLTFIDNSKIEHILTYHHIAKFKFSSLSKENDVKPRKILEDYASDNVYDSELEVIFTRTTMMKIYNAFSNNTNNKKIKIGVISAGKAELNIVTLGYIYLLLLGYDVYPSIDFGIDNLKKTRLIIDRLNTYDIIITTAGMEAILPSVIANICYKPVIAVPSNVSYGFGSDGRAPMRSIINSDVPGIATFNVGNIYGACIFAHNIAQYLLNRQINLETEIMGLFEPSYSQHLKLIKQDGTEKINIIKQYNKYDIINGIRINYPLMNVDDKTTEQIIEFTKKHKYYILRGKSIDKSFTHFGKNTGIICSNISSDIIEKRKKVFDTSKSILIICGGMRDNEYANELKTFLSFNGIDCDICESLNLNLPLLYEEECKQLFSNYDIFVVIAGTNGTITNMVGRIVGNKPVIAIPTNKFGDKLEDVTLMSILNNCVGGIATVNVNNVYSANCLICSILFNYTGEIETLVQIHENDILQKKGTRYKDIDDDELHLM